LYIEKNLPKRNDQIYNGQPDAGCCMVGSGNKDRLSPPLMYAFRSAFAARDATKKIDIRDEQGERVIASRRISSRAAISEPVLRREIAHDLEDLLNTVALESSLALDEYQFVRRSVLNYGLPDLAHRSIDENSIDDIKGEIKTALVNYEPRLLAESIRVERDPAVDQAQLKIRFVANAELICQPVNVPIEFIAEVELDSAKIQISRL
jgi:type VI secretion system protein ImpF